MTSDARATGPPIPAGAAVFSLFAALWAVAGVFHHLSFMDWRWSGRPGLLLALAGAAVLLRPSSWPRLAVFVAIDWLMGVRTMPAQPNHIFFSWVVNSTLLLTLAFAWKRRTGTTTLAADWCRWFAPWVRVQLGVLYFFSFFHKLNSAFLNPEFSCAATMQREIGDWLPGWPGGPWAQWAAIGGTLLFEALIPVLLAIRRTRAVGLLAGILFHSLLALHPHLGIFSFTATVFALFALFLPDDFAARLRLPDEWQRLARWLVLGWGIFIVIWAVRGLTPVRASLESWWTASAPRIGFFLALAYGAGVFTAVLWRCRRSNPGPAGELLGSVRRWPVLWLLPLLLVAVGLQPYLGLRTQVCFSMFSNLQTEGGRSNHLLMPDRLQLTRWQHDLVEILETNHQLLKYWQREGLTVPYLELRRVRTLAGPGLQVRFRRGNQILHFAADDPATHPNLEPLGPIALRYLIFRPVERDPREVWCRW